MKFINKETKFRKWRYWSDWVDVLGFTYDHDGYILQGRTNRFNGKQFKCVRAGFRTGAFGAIGYNNGENLFEVLENIDNKER